MKRKLILLWKSLFVMTSAECENLGLRFQGNVHGDLINLLGCRSVYVDEFDNEYRCSDYMPDPTWPGIRKHSHGLCDYCRISRNTVTASIDGGDVGTICRECSERFLYCFSCGSKQSFEYELSYVDGDFKCQKCSIHLTVNK